MRFSEWFAVALCVAACRSESPATVRVAAAANVVDALTSIAADQRARSGLEIEISAGSSGKLAAQIENGAPFHVFLSADAARPARLEAGGHAVAGTRFSYAIGRLALCGRKLGHPSDGLRELREARFRNFAIANPETAPYGTAAVQVLERAGVWRDVQGRTVRGESVAQTLHFVESGSAELGLLALSTVRGRKALQCWPVPSTMHDPIRQDAVLLEAGRDHAAARSFLEALRAPESRALFRQAGYEHDP